MAGARQPGFCFFAGTSSLRAPHDVSKPGAGGGQAECTLLAVPSQAQPPRHSRELKAANRLVLHTLSSSEPFVILCQPFRTEHHLLEVKPLPWNRHFDGSMVARGGMARFWSLESLQMGACE